MSLDYDLRHSEVRARGYCVIRIRVPNPLERDLTVQKHNLNVLIDYDDERFRPKILMNEPGYRMVLLSLRAGQRIPEHASREGSTVHAIVGHITLIRRTFP